MTDRVETDKTDPLTQAAQVASDALVDLFNSLNEAAALTHPRRAQRITDGLTERKIIIRAHIDMDVDGPLSFLFFELRDELEKPRLVFDVTPKGTTRQ